MDQKIFSMNFLHYSDIALVISMNYLLVEPEFPIPIKSRNHKNFLPIGLLKLVAMLEEKGNTVIFVRGNIGLLGLNILSHKQTGKGINETKPDEIWITSLFTYWIGNVTESVRHYRKLFDDNVKIVVGGIAASLLGSERIKDETECDQVFQGVHPEAENISADKMQEIYDRYLKSIDFQVLHAQRGCFRKCSFCGTWKIEPEVKVESSIKDKIFKKGIIFYDNNFLQNENIDYILDELIELKKARKISWCECQSGFDGRLLIKDDKLPEKLKAAGFRNIRLAWDGKYNQHSFIKKQIDLLVENEKLFKIKNIEIFMLYNWNIPFYELERKRVKCFKWGVQISDCRFRLLDRTTDNYKPRKLDQTDTDYHINCNWNDLLIKQFRRNVRRHNICIRHNFHFYVKDFERKITNMEIIGKFVKSQTREEQESVIRKYGLENWDPLINDTEKELRKRHNKNDFRLLH